MAASAGAASRIAIGDATTAMTHIAFQSESLQETIGFINGNGITGTRSHYIERIREGVKNNGGNLTWFPQTSELAVILPKIHGANASGTSYPLGEQPASIIALKEIESSNVHSFPSLYVNQASFSGSHGQAISLSVDFVGTSSVTVQSGFPTSTSLTFNTANDFFAFQDAVLIIAGTTYSMSSFNLTINNAIELRQANSRTATAAIATDRSVTLEVTLYEGDTTAAFSTFTDADVTASLTCTTNNQSLAYTFAGIRFTNQTPVINGRGEITYPITGQCMRTSAAAEFACVLDSTP